MQLLRTILIIIIVYYAFRLFARYVMPWLARYVIRKSMQDAGRQQEARQKKNGEVTIDPSPNRKGALDNIGEYVDYEEVDEDKNEKL